MLCGSMALSKALEAAHLLERLDGEHGGGGASLRKAYPALLDNCWLSIIGDRNISARKNETGEIAAWPLIAGVATTVLGGGWR